MKGLNIFILFVLLSCIVASCGGGVDDFITEEGNKRQEQHIDPVYPRFSDPMWTQLKRYENSMVVAIQLPDSLISSFNKNDKMAVLCGEEVRGVLDVYALSQTENVWMGMVSGDTNETLRIGYYSASTRYMYYSKDNLRFTTDSHYGTIDNPVRVAFSIVTKK